MSNSIKFQLEASGYGGLYEILSQLVGMVIGKKYILLEPYAVGGQSILWTTANKEYLSQTVITQFPLLSYQRPAYLDASKTYQRRKNIEFQAQLLSSYNGEILPSVYGLFYDHNPLYPKERPTEIRDRETYLVMEHIKGIPGKQKIIYLHAQEKLNIKEIEKFSVQIAETALALFLKLKEIGYLYTDFNPRNIILETSPTHKIRVIDAGSIIPIIPADTFEIPFTEAYVPSEYYKNIKSKEKIWPTEKFVLCTLGKTLWQILSNKQPIPGEELHFDTYLNLYSPSMLDFVINLIIGNIQDFDEAKLALNSLKTELGFSR